MGLLRGVLGRLLLLFSMAILATGCPLAERTQPPLPSHISAGDLPLWFDEASTSAFITMLLELGSQHDFIYTLDGRDVGMAHHTLRRIESTDGPRFELSTDETLSISTTVGHERRVLRFAAAYPYSLTKISSIISAGEQRASVAAAVLSSYGLLDIAAPSLWVRRHPMEGQTLEVRWLNPEDFTGLLVTYQMQRGLPEGFSVPPRVDENHLVYTVARVSPDEPIEAGRIIEETVWLDEGTVLWRRDRAFLEYRAVPDARLGTAPSDDPMPTFRRGTPGLEDTAADARVGAATVKIVSLGGTGSGVLISNEGIILTAQHVVSASLRGGGGLRVPDLQGTAEVIYESPTLDFALLRATPDHGVTWPRLACLSLRKQDLPVGEAIHAIGFPRATPGDAATRSDGVRQLSTDGLVLRYSAGDLGYLRVLETEGVRRAQSLVLATPRVIPGMSGGPVVSDGGDLLGISVMSIHHSWPVSEEATVGTYLGILPASVIASELRQAWGNERVVADLHCAEVTVEASEGASQEFYPGGAHDYLRSISQRFDDTFFALARALPDLMELAGRTFCQGDSGCPDGVVALLVGLMPPESRTRLLSTLWFHALDELVGAISPRDRHPGVPGVSPRAMTRALRESLPRALTAAFMDTSREVVLNQPMTAADAAAAEVRVHRALEHAVRGNWVRWAASEGIHSQE